MTGPEAIAAAERLLSDLSTLEMELEDDTLRETAWAADVVRHAITELSTLRAALFQSQEALLTIAGLVNGYHNDGTTLSAAASLRAVAEAIGPALSPPVASKKP